MHGIAITLMITGYLVAAPLLGFYDTSLTATDNDGKTAAEIAADKDHTVLLARADGPLVYPGQQRGSDRDLAV